MRKTMILLSICLFGYALGLGAQAPPPANSAAPTPPAADAAKKEADAKKPEPPKDKPFAEIVKDAQAVKGLFTLYRTDEKVFLEILPEQLEKLFLLSMTIDSGIGERGFYAGDMWGNGPIFFRKQGKNIQLLTKNVEFIASEKEAFHRAIPKSFSDSVLGVTKIESLPHPERKSLLIDAGAIFLTDLPMLGYWVDRTFRVGHRFDTKNSFFGKLKSFERNTEIETVAHYASERPPMPPLLAPGQPPPPQVAWPRNVRDVRSMIFHLRYSLSEPPQTGYRPRLVDDRVGHFYDQVEDYSSDTHYTATRRFVNRWHLEKADPAAAVSRPKQPIVFWMENTIPVKYRDAIRDGVLVWNKAFERIGFKDAVEVRQQPDDADWDPADVRYSTIRWIGGTDAGFAQGPSYTDPRTGQIYDADIRYSEGMTRFFRREAHEFIGPLSMPWETESFQPMQAPWSSKSAGAFCNLADFAVRDAEFAFDLMMARGMEPDSPEADRFVHVFLKWVSAHEVGHTLGLRHNFRASTIHSFDQLHNTEATTRDGLTGSVMEYVPSNIAARGQKQGEYHMSGLGAYDYWAIEYAYKPIDAATPQEELPELKRIASRVADPKLAYGTDEDAGFGPGLDMDPSVIRNDLGSDPLKYYAHRVKLSQEILANMEEKLPKKGEGYQVLRRSFGNAIGNAGFNLAMAARSIGGVQYYRDHVGDPGNRVPYQPVPAAQQKQALELIKTQLFSSKAFQFSPVLLNKLAGERFIDWRAFNPGRADVPVHGAVLNLQRGVLDRLYHPMVLSRVLDNEVKVTNPAEAFTLGHLFTGIKDSIWSELKPGAEALNINTYRRALQRAHLGKLIGMVLRDASVPEDARTLARYQLTGLKTQLQAALARKSLIETRAHLSESLARVDEALKANMQRTAF